MTRWWQNDASEWSEEQKEDVAEVIKYTSRDDTGISYEVSLALRSLAESAYEDGEDRVTCWTKRVDFGTSDANCSGGYEFVRAARRQEQIAEQISVLVWGRR